MPSARADSGRSARGNALGRWPTISSSTSCCAASLPSSATKTFAGDRGVEPPLLGADRRRRCASILDPVVRDRAASGRREGLCRAVIGCVGGRVHSAVLCESLASDSCLSRGDRAAATVIHSMPAAPGSARAANCRRKSPWHVLEIDRAEHRLAGAALVEQLAAQHAGQQTCTPDAGVSSDAVAGVDERCW